MEQKIIGVIWRYGKNDYQISLADFNKADERALLKIDMKYGDNDGYSCVRGDENISIKDANIEYWENGWAKQELENVRKNLAKKAWNICKNDNAFYDDREDEWFDEKQMYESLGTAKGCAYFMETVLQFYDGSEQTKCYYDLTMDIVHYMEWYLEDK